MPSARLQQQFIRLWQCCEGKSQDTTLNELAALLSCSRRVTSRFFSGLIDAQFWTACATQKSPELTTNNN